MSGNQFSIAQVNSRPWLEELLKSRCGFENVRGFQLQHGLDLIEGKDLFLVIAPGQGKTTVMLAPLLAAQERGESGVAIIIVPTKVLAEQTAETMNSRGIRALAINEDTVRDAAYEKRNLFKELSTGRDIRVGVMSPQMLRSRRMSELIGSVALKQEVRWFFVDEVHLLSEEATDWRASYATVKFMRARLLSTTTWAAVTGTATPTEAKLIASRLGFKPGHYVNARYSVDRPHIKYITRFMAFPSSGDEFFDLAFLVPPNVTSPEDIPRTFVFCETIELGSRVMFFLDRLLPEALPGRANIVKTYNSLMSRQYRQDFICDIQAGSTLRIGICTDTCTYGLDVPCIRRVVNYGLCQSFSTEKQRLCRAGRDGLPALAYSIVPSWVKEVPEGDAVTVQAKEHAARREKLPDVVRRWHNPTTDACPRRVDLEHNEETCRADTCQGQCSTHEPNPELAEDETCIQFWLTKLHGGRASTFSNTRVPIPRSDGTHRRLEPQMVQSLIRMLMHWRVAKWTEVRGSNRDVLSVQFLSTAVLVRIAEKAHICTTMARLERVIGLPQWTHLARYGQSLLDYLSIATTEFDAIFAARHHDSESAGSDMEVTNEDDEDDNLDLHPSSPLMPAHEGNGFVRPLVITQAGGRVAITERTNLGSNMAVTGLRVVIPSKRPSDHSPEGSHSKRVHSSTDKENL